MTSLPALAPPPSSDWRVGVACAEMDPTAFFPAGTATQVARQAEVAKRACRSCASTAACLAWAMETNQTLGIWGGKDEAERRQLRWPARDQDGRGA
jgi:WhiB family redox-sensing transcriptional regulator